MELNRVTVRWHDGYIYEKDYKKYMKDQKKPVIAMRKPDSPSKHVR